MHIIYASPLLPQKRIAGKREVSQIKFCLFLYMYLAFFFSFFFKSLVFSTSIHLLKFFTLYHWFPNKVSVNTPNLLYINYNYCGCSNGFSRIFIFIALCLDSPINYLTTYISSCSILALPLLFSVFIIICTKKNMKSKI